MRRYSFFMLLVIGSLSAATCLAQSPTVPSPADSQNAASTRNHEATSHLRDLTLLSTVRAAHVNAGMFLWPLKCDRDGNLYLRNLIDGVPAILDLVEFRAACKDRCSLVLEQQP